MVTRSSIRTRLMALLLVPAAGLIAVAGLQLGEAYGVVTGSSAAEQLTQIAQAERDLLHTLQIERTRSLEYVADLAGGVPAGAPEPLVQAREAVEGARSALDATLAEVDLARIGPEVLETDAEATAALAALEPLRFNLDAGRAEGQNVIRAFDDPIEALLLVDQRVIALIDQAAVQSDLQGSLAISQIKDAAIRAGDVVLLAASGALEPDEAQALLAEAQGDVQTWLGVAQTYLDATAVTQVTTALEGLPTDGDTAELLGDDAEEALAEQADGMADLSESSANSLRILETAATDSAVSAAAGARDDAVVRAIVLAIITGVVLAISLLLLLLLLRGVVGPLRQLTALADRVRTTLPDTVERVAGGQDAGESAFDEPQALELTNRPDELGELARAIRASTDEATRVAADQAATRAGVTRTIEDVARREQTLVERQLSLLDQLEDAEEDPDQLAQLFRLDHLATRMRRNAENLLLLASGRLPGGQDTTPVPLIDVVRTAAAEIEQYARVDVRVGVNSTVVGYAGTPLSHLLAELIENATQFSPPTARVSVGARLSPEGVIISIADRGIGMSSAEIDDARRRLAAPPLLEAAESRRLGLYVVGLIATRIGVTVDLHADDGASGLVVEVAIPQQLFLVQSTERPLPPVTAPVPDPAAGADRDGAITPQGTPPAVPTPLRAGPPPIAGPPTQPDRLAPAGPRLSAVPDLVEPPPLPGRTPPPAAIPAPAARQVEPDAVSDFLASLPRLETPPDALSEMGHLLDAQPATPPALPPDVEPPEVDQLPNRGDALPRRGSGSGATSSLSLSAASGGRTVDLNPQEVGQLMASLSGEAFDLYDDDDDDDDDVERFTAAAAPAPAPPAAPSPIPPTPPTPPAARPAVPPPDWSAIDVDAALDQAGSDDTPGPAPAPASKRRGRSGSSNKKNGTASSWSTPFPPHGT